MTERATFTADGITLIGDLRPAGPGAPAMVLTGPFTGVKEQVTGTYARLLHDRGVTTLAFDHRGFGESGGRRAHEGSQGKLADLRIRAVAGIAGGYNSPAAFAAGNPDGYRGALAGFIEKYDDELPAVAPSGGAAAMGGDEPCSYYGTDRSTAELHVDLYGTEPYVSQAADVTAAFLHQHLG